MQALKIQDIQMQAGSLVKTRPFSVVTELWSGKASLITHFQRGVTNGRRSNASGRNWIDLKPIRAIVIV